MIRWARSLAVLMLLSLAAGCASVGAPSAEDPLEGFNRSMHSFNDGFDQAIGKPVATAYRDVVPEPMRYWVRNFFSNIADLFIGVNNLLQGKPVDALTDWTRFALNSTIGLFGVLDFASEVGIEKHDEDFGQTFGRWGVGNGAYIVLPLLGSSTMRDGVGLIFDYAADPVVHHKPIAVRNLMTVTRVTGKRADLLDASRILEEAALDRYIFQRDAYLQRRRSLIHDGNPPRAGREVPRAEAAEEPLRAPSPASQAPALQLPAQVSIEAAVEMLEAPAGALRSGG